MTRFRLKQAQGLTIPGNRPTQALASFLRLYVHSTRAKKPLSARVNGVLFLQCPIKLALCRVIHGLWGLYQSAFQIPRLHVAVNFYLR